MVFPFPSGAGTVGRVTNTVKSDPLPPGAYR
jgi:hypothetical protein